MEDKRQNTESTDCNPKGTSEARDAGSAGFESYKAESDKCESTAQLMEEVVESENVKAAIRKVQKNGGAPGFDGITVESLVPYMAANWQRIRKQLLEGSYKPQPVRRIEIPKPGGGKRTLGIPTVLDRVIQQAFLQVLQPKWDPTFSERSHGFRPKHSQHQAVKQAQDSILAGHEYVVDLDLEQFFDRVNHDILMARVAKRIADKRALRILRAFLDAGILANGLVKPSTEGVPQGGPLSPLLSNLLLDDLDKELEKRGLQFVRFADDCNIYVKSERAGLRVKASVTEFLQKKLKLKVNEEKSAVGKPSSRKFLGFTFGVKENCPRLIAPQSMSRAKAKVKSLIAKGRHKTFEATSRSVGQYLRHWLNYFGYTERVSEVRELFGFSRRHLRRLAWVQWKTPQRRSERLIALGVKRGTAFAVSNTSKGPWCLSKTPSLNSALSNAYFHTLGFPRLLNGERL